jgi:hypothetical protein
MTYDEVDVFLLPNATKPIRDMRVGVDGKP